MKHLYPLEWPLGYKRTANRVRSPFKITMEGAQRHLHNQVRLIRGSNLLISTNLRVRNDGGFYTDDMRRHLPDPGVAICFTYKGKEVTMCCDKYLTLGENLSALGRGIEALRGMERWGVSDFLDRAFTGFTALPPAYEMGPAKRPWWEVLELEEACDEEDVKKAFRLLSKKHHPDVGGDKEKFQELVDAVDEATRSLLHRREGVI